MQLFIHPFIHLFNTSYCVGPEDVEEKNIDLVSSCGLSLAGMHSGDRNLRTLSIQLTPSQVESENRHNNININNDENYYLSVD